MPAKDHAAWDTLPERLHPRAADPEQPRVGREPAQLTAERVALVEAPPEPEDLRAEYEARVRSWAPAEAGRGVVLTLIGVTFVMALGLLALAATTSPLLAAPILLLWAPLGYLGWRRLNHRRTLTGRAASRCCPDCGFDLAGTPAGIDAEAFGVDVGPRRCPECGALWPLVPPPAIPDAEPRPYTRAMPPKDHAAWDLLPVLPKTSGDGTPLERAVRARTEAYERASCEPGEATASLAAEHRRRLDAWALGGAFFGRGLTVLFIGVPALFALLGVTAVVVKGSWPPRVQDLQVLLWSLAPTVIFLILARTFRTVLRPRRRLGARCCPDCGYDLRGAPAGIDPAVLGVDVGPRWCPECGGFWPLVPPAPVHGA